MLKHLLIALGLVTAPVIALGMLQGGGELSGFWVPDDANPTITFIGCTPSDSNLTEYTFSGHSVGTARGTRRTIVGIVSEDSASVFGVNSVTIGGDAATEINDVGAADSINAALYRMDNPSGTSEDIVVTHSEAVTSATICVAAAYDLASSIPTANTTASSGTLSLNTTALGVGFAVCGNTVGTGNTAIWAGFTEQADATTAETAYSAADFTEDASASTPLTVTCNWSSGGDTAGASAFFR